MKSIFLFATLLTLPTAVLSQEGYDGFKRAGEAFSGNSQNEAYRQGAEQALRREIAIQQAIEARQNADLSKIETEARERITKFWLLIGLPEKEATGVSSEFRLQSQQIPINERAQRDGFEKTIIRALKAYSDYDYLLANQLLVAADRISGTTPEQLSAAQKAIEVEKVRIGIGLQNP